MKLVFMGTPAFAVPTLETLTASPHQILSVVTNPDRPRGRGRQPSPPPVKQTAGRLGLNVMQPETLKDPQLADQLRELAPDLFIVVAFSILPAALLSIPRAGSVNLHPSLLPAYRGAAPIIWAVINGDTETGLTTFLLDKRVDTGGILLQRRVAIDARETAGELDARLRLMGADLVLKTVDQLEHGLHPRPQDETAVTRARKLTREDGRIRWERPAADLHNHIRGTNPVPGAFTEWSGGLLKIHRTHTVAAAAGSKPGTLLSADARTGLVVATGNGGLALDQVQPAGKKAMEGSAFVRGSQIAAGNRFGLGD